MSEATTSADVVVIGAGPAGMMAAITAAARGKQVIICEHMSRPGQKLLATGGGRCNLCNTLDVEAFIARCGKQGRFMRPAIATLDSQALRDFFAQLGVTTHAPDGFHVFPTDHKASTVRRALLDRMAQASIQLLTNCEVRSIDVHDNAVHSLTSSMGRILTQRLILASGGRSYPKTGSNGLAYELAAVLGHNIVATYPAMLPLHTRETWTATCTADTVPGAEVWLVQNKKRRRLGRGDLIFTREGIAGPVVLDVAREITPFLDTTNLVRLEIDVSACRGQQWWHEELAKWRQQRPSLTVVSTLREHIAASLAPQLCQMAQIDGTQRNAELSRQQVESLKQLLTRMPLHVVATAGFAQAMITRGGISRRDVDPNSMQSRQVKGLYFCGEVLDVDGPCGGYNLHWAFASGYLAGTSTATS